MRIKDFDRVTKKTIDKTLWLYQKLYSIMLAALKQRRNAACDPPKKSLSEAVKARQKERMNVVSSIQALNRDVRLLSSWKHQYRKKKRSKRVAKLSQIEIEKLHFKKWIRYRNPILNHSIDIAKKRRNLLREWFGFLDDDDSQSISRVELGTPLISLGLARDMEEVDRLIASVDQDGSGDIDFFEFEEMLLQGAGGPIQTLLHSIQSGELGDPRVASVKSLMTTARRRKICSTLQGYGRRTTHIAAEDKKDRTTIRELQKMSEDGGASAADEAVESLVAETGRVVEMVGTLNEKNIDQHEKDLDEKIHVEVHYILENDPTKKWLPPLGGSGSR